MLVFNDISIYNGTTAYLHVTDLFTAFKLDHRKATFNFQRETCKVLFISFENCLHLLPNIHRMDDINLSYT